MNSWLVFVTVLSILVALAAVVVAWRATRENALRSEARVALLAAEIHGTDMPSPAPEPAKEPGVPRQWAVIGVLTVAMVILVLTIAGLRAPATSRHDTAATKPSRAANPAPLELVELTDSPTPDGLLVTGRVHNPGRTPRENLSVMVVVLDEGGVEVGHGLSDVAETDLAPGATATFAVSIPSRTAATRYRVSFHEGSMAVPHRDGRTARIE